MKRRAALLWALVILVLLPAGARAVQVPAGPGPVWVIELADTVNPAAAQFLAQGLKQAAQAEAACVVIRLDTPGGLAQSMRRMVKDILACPVPVVVYVAPAGARAASAGAFLLLAAPLAAMAPATNLGAAHPVGAGGQDIEGDMAGKIVADLTALARSLAKRRGRDPDLAARMVTQSLSLDAAAARDKGLVDILAPNLGELLRALQDRVVEAGGKKRRIDTRGRALHFYKPGARMRLLSFLADPNLAYILMMIGMAGLFFELSNPGAIFPGVVGGISLVLALFAMSTLPVSYTGLALLGLALVFFIAEIKVVSHGLLSLAGAVSLILGSFMLFDSEDELLRVSLWVILPTAGGVLAFFLGVTWLALGAQLKRPSTGQEGLVGQKAVVVDQGRVRIMGELWRAQSQVPLSPGQEVEVTAVEGLLLTVRPLPPEGERRN